MEPGREVCPQRDHQDPKGGNRGRDRALDSIPGVTFPNRSQQELQRLNLRLSLGRATDVRRQSLPFGLLGSPTPEDSHSPTSRTVVSRGNRVLGTSQVVVNASHMSSGG